MDDGRQVVHDAIQDWIGEDGEVVTRWCLTAELILPDGRNATAHRAGGLGGSSPTVTEAIGMMGGSLAVAFADYLESTHDTEE